VVGAHEDDDQGPNSGSAYVYSRPAGGWAGTLTETAKLTASDGTVHDDFGGSVSVSGETILIGAPEDDENGLNSGSAYVYARPDTGWATTSEFAAKLTPSDGAADDYFGESVSVSDDTVVVGALGDDDKGSASGSAYIFVRPATGWTTTDSFDAKLTALDAAESDAFGTSVNIDGDIVAVGARSDDDNGDRSGSVHVYVRPETGWATTSDVAAKLLASDGADGDWLGYAVGVSGNTVIAGAPYRSDRVGAAYLFTYEPGQGFYTAGDSRSATRRPGRSTVSNSRISTATARTTSRSTCRWRRSSTR
jgi:hypothetical protein